MKNIQGEKGAANSAELSGLGFMMNSQEFVRASGQYAATLRIAKPEHETEYLRLLSHHSDLHARQPLGRSLKDIAVSRKLRGEALEVESYMQTLMEIQKELIAPNVVTDVGARYLLDNGLAGSTYTAAFFLGLISLTSYTGVAAADTMASHAGWLEAAATNAPTYSGSRKTAAWSAAATRSKALSTGLVFTFTGSGTVKGCFLTTIATVDTTTGTLYSAGLFTGGDQPVVSTNTLTVSYTASL